MQDVSDIIRLAPLLAAIGSCTLPDVSFDAVAEDAGPQAQGGSGGAPGECTSTTSYRDAVMADAPIAYWRLGDLQDSSGRALTLSRNGNVASDRAGALRCDGDTAMGFSGTGYLTHPKTPALEPEDSLTLEFWMQQSGPPTVFEKPLWYGNANGPPYGAWGFERWKEQPATQFSFFVNQGGTPGHVHSTAFAQLDRWYYVAATYDGTTMRLYVDGVLSGEAGPPSLPGGPIQYPDPFGFAIGACQGPYSLYSGLIDEVAIYDKALSQERISAHYAAASQ